MSKDRVFSSEIGVSHEAEAPTLKVVAIFTSPSLGEPMVARESVVAVAGGGLEGTDLCTPCVRPGELLAREIKAQQAFVKAFLRTGGLRVKVLEGGQIDKGSKINFD